MLLTAIEAAKEASEIILDNFENNNLQTMESKNDKSWVTDVDIACERAITEVIKRKYPSHSILAEEAGFIDNDSEYTWIIDPLDGTHNFIHKIPLCGVNIALAKDRKPMIGVMSLPFQKELYTAKKGEGAFLNDNRIKVSDNEKFEDSLLLLTSNFKEETAHRADRIKKILIQKPHDVRAFGCSVYELSLIAKGAADAKISFFTRPWDIAAGFLIVEEAGGKVTTHDNKPWHIDIKGFIASNGKLHDQLLDLI